MTTRKRRRDVSPTAVVIAVVLCLVWSIPFLVMVSTSLKLPSEIFTGALLPEHPTWDNFTQILNEPNTWVMLRNTSIIVAGTTISSVAAGTLCAFGLHRVGLSARSMGYVVFLLLFIRFYPRIATAIPFFVMMRDMGLFDTPVAVILGHLGITIPFATWLLLITFQGLPDELDEAARVDGANLFQRFTKVSLPLAKTGMATAAVLTAVLSWNEFLIASTLTSANNPVLSVGVASYLTDRGVQFGPMAALSVLICTPIVALTLALQRHFVAGMTLGAVKG